MVESEISAERVARNNVIFRDANEGIGEAAQRYGAGGSIPFICECPDQSCTEIIRVPLAEYREVRSVETQFLNAPGHDRAAQGWSTVVDRRDGYDVVEKVGRAAEHVLEIEGEKEADGRA